MDIVKFATDLNIIEIRLCVCYFTSEIVEQCDDGSYIIHAFITGCWREIHEQLPHVKMVHNYTTLPGDLEEMGIVETYVGGLNL